MPDLAVSAPPAPIFLAGPTAVGKSEVALALAQQLDGESDLVTQMLRQRALILG